MALPSVSFAALTGSTAARKLRAPPVPLTPDQQHGRALLTPPGQARLGPHFDALHAKYLKLPSVWSSQCWLVGGLLALLLSQVAWQWSVSNIRGVVQALPSQYLVFVRLGSALGIAAAALGVWRLWRRHALEEALGSGLEHLTAEQRALLGLPPGRAKASAVSAKAAESKAAQAASAKVATSRARSAMRARRGSDAGSTPAPAGGSRRAARFAAVRGLSELAAPAASAASVMHSPELLGRRPSRPSATGAALGLDASFATEAAGSALVAAAAGPGRPSPRRGAGTLASPAARALQRQRGAGDDVFDADVIAKLLGGPGAPGTGYQVAEPAGLVTAVGVADAKRVAAELGVTSAELDELRPALKRWLAGHIAGVFLPTLEANVAALHDASRELQGGVRRATLSRGFLRRSDARQSRARGKLGEWRTLGELLRYYTQSSTGHTYFNVKRVLPLSRGGGREPWEDAWGGDGWDEWGGGGGGGGGASLPDEAAQFWLAGAGRKRSRSVGADGRRSGGAWEDGGGRSDTVSLNVSLWHERGRLEQFLDLVGRHGGNGPHDEGVKHYVLRRLEQMGRDELSSFSAAEPAAPRAGDASGAAAGSGGFPSDAQIILAYFVAALDSLLSPHYPGELEPAHGTLLLKETALTRAGKRGRFSAEHLCVGRRVPEEASEGGNPVLHVVSGLAARDVHLRLVLDGVSYDPALETAPGGGAAYAAGDADASLWRGLALLLTVLQRDANARAKVAGTGGDAGLRQRLLAPLFSAPLSSGSGALDSFGLREYF